MAFRKIIEYPSTKLLKASINVDAVDDSVKQNVADLVDTLNVVGGVGLSAPQLGIHKRIIYVKTENFKGAMINPKILSFDEQRMMPESCLSFPGVFEKIFRYNTVNVEYTDITGKRTAKKLTGLPAQVVQHEIEHLDGKLMLDHMSRMKRSIFVRKIKKLQKKASEYFVDSVIDEKKIGRQKKNAHLSQKEIRIRKKNRKQSR